MKNLTCEQQKRLISLANSFFNEKEYDPERLISFFEVNGYPDIFMMISKKIKDLSDNGLESAVNYFVKNNFNFINSVLADTEVFESMDEDVKKEIISEKNRFSKIKKKYNCYSFY